MNFYGAFAGTDMLRRSGHANAAAYQSFFVKEHDRPEEIGRLLFDTMCRDYETQEFTVDSSPYAVAFYRRPGFPPTDTEQLTNGIRYTPMYYPAPLHFSC